ncbi:hypothetical protein FACS189456_7300 [Bacteroidia bacterium]|nr:hypothetical protein FACS189456_7300 [Bacteroidia bacterium]
MKGYITTDTITSPWNAEDKYVYTFNHFHNQILDEVVQFGFLGAIPLGALFIYLAVLAFRRRDYLLFAFLGIYLPFCCVESPLMTIKGIIPMMFWLCLIVSTQKERQQINS